MSNRSKLIFILFLYNSYSYGLDVSSNTSINGFGTLGGSYNSNENILFRDNVFSNVGSKGDFSLTTHSKLGLQLDHKISDSLEATLQEVGSKKRDGKIDLDLDWANVKYTPNDNISFKLGRMQLPVFMYSDSTNLNYANTWTHLPKEIYSLIPFKSFNGIETEIKQVYNDHNFNLEFSSGYEKDNIYTQEGIADTRLKNLFGVSLSDTYKNFKVRSSYFQGDGKIAVDELYQLIDVAKSMGINSAQNYSLDDLKFKYYSLGSSYQGDNLFLSGEYVWVDSNNKVVDNINGWYISSGYQFDKIMPYITYGKAKQKGATSDDIPVLDPIYGGDFIKTQFDKMISIFAYTQESISYGLRYDIYENMALKFQMDRIYYKQGAKTIHYMDDVPFDKKHFDVYSITLDFVF